MVLERMTALGMQRQVDLVRASDAIASDIGLDTGISESTASRLIYSDNYMPDRDTLALLARTLQVDFDELILFVHGGPGRQAPSTVGHMLHPLAVELNQMLAEDSGVPDEDRAALEALTERIHAPLRKFMRRRRHRSA